MILFVNQNNEIYAYSTRKSKEELHRWKDAVWYEGEFSERMGENIAGKRKKFFYEDGEIRIEYEVIPEREESLSQEEMLAEVLLNTEYTACLLEEQMENA